MNKIGPWAGALSLVLVTGQAQAHPVIQLNTTLANPAQCGSQLDAATAISPAFAYVTIARDVNYVIEKGDRLTYEVRIPKESTLAAGAVDFNLSAAPKAKNSGATLRDSYSAVDQYGLFAHPASNYDLLSTRAVQTCGPTGKPEMTPLFARGVWLPREIDLSALRVDASGSAVAIRDVMLAIDTHDSTHMQDVCPTDATNARAIALFRKINIVNTDAQGKLIVKRAIYNSEEKLPNGEVTVAKGSFSNASAAVTLVDGHALDAPAPYEPVGSDADDDGDPHP